MKTIYLRKGTLKDYFIAIGLTFKNYYEFPLK